MHKILFFVSCWFFNNSVCHNHYYQSIDHMYDFDEGYMARVDEVNAQKQISRESFNEFVQCYKQKKADEQSKEELNKKLFEVACDIQVKADLQHSMIKTLLELGASAACVATVEFISDMKTPLGEVISRHCLFDEDRTKSISALIAAGAPVLPGFLHGAVMDLHMPLQKRLAIVKTLVCAKADVNVEKWCWGSALFCLGYGLMKEEDACEVFKIFTNAEPKPNFNKRYEERTSLENALSWGRFKLTALFVEAGARYSDIEKSKKSQLVGQGIATLLSKYLNVWNVKKKENDGRLCQTVLAYLGD